jgi:branched-chain amino acid transport system ATP-binding protein
MTTPLLLAADGLVRRFGSLTAVDGVDLRVTAGERHALIGPNGAGKTTVLNLLGGADRPTVGWIWFDGRDITGLGPARRARLGIGRTHQRPAVWPTLTVRENVAVGAWWQTRGRRRAAVQDWLERLDLAAHASTQAGTLSHGQRRHLELAMALAGEPRLLLLDEPTAGLPGDEVRRLGALLASLPRTIAVVLVEHHLDLVYSFADTITVLREGRVAAYGAPADIRLWHAAGLDVEAVR